MSRSARIIWDPQNIPANSYKVYRNTANDFSTATLVGSPAAGSFYFNDYGPLTPATQYYYWVTRVLNGAESVPSDVVSITTAAAQVQNDPMSPAQQTAIWAWANDLFSSLYTVQWANEPMDKGLRPLILLNIVSIAPTGLTDDIRNAHEDLSGGRIAMVSVKVMTDPEPPINGRGIIQVPSPAAGTYTATINGVAYTATLTGTPTNDAILVALQAAIDPGVARAVICGNDSSADPAQVEFIVVESAVPSTPLTLTVTGNMTASLMTVLDAWTIIGRLFSSLGLANIRDTFNAAGMGVGSLQPINDLSGPLDTRFEIRAQFDFAINIDSDMPVNTPIIDTVTSVDGALNP